MQVHNKVKEYYGKVLKKTSDLKTSACCTNEKPPKHIQEALLQLHDDVVNKYYGCGLVIPEDLKGKKILDLGSGSGRDCYLLSQLVGEEGQVIGIDMTPEMIDTASKYIDYHTQKFGYKKPNVAFYHGYIEKLSEVPELISYSNSFDIIISNCVVNLSPNKQQVFKQAWKFLKEGGEFYFSDVYSDRRVPSDCMQNEVLWGECLSGALYWNDFLDISASAGFKAPRVVKCGEISITNADARKLLGPIRFFSITCRLWKIPELEPSCEDYGQAVKYNGTIENCEDYFDLDKYHRFEKKKIKTVCGNTWLMLANTRFKPHFEFYGDWEKHYGVYLDYRIHMPWE